MRKLLTIALFFIVTNLQAQAGGPGMEEIFNGKNLEGWVVPESNIWWRVNGGILTAKSGAKKKGSILWTEEHYKDFIFQTDFKMGEGTVDSGIFLRQENIQIQIGISGSLQRDMTASPYVPGKGYPVEAEKVKEVLNPAGWNTMKVEARGNSFTVWLNGHKVMQYTAEQAIAQGPIGLQLHPGNKMSIEFRQIKVAEL